MPIRALPMFGVLLAVPMIATFPATAPDQMNLTPAMEISDIPLLSGVDAYRLYGGFAQGVPTAIISRTEPGQAMAIPQFPYGRKLGFRTCRKPRI